MIKINVISNNNKWKKYLKDPINYIEKKIEKLNKKNIQYQKKVIFCTLLLSSNNEIKELNKRFRNKNESTDVLSFPFYNKKEFVNKIKKDKEIYLGDIIVNLNKIKSKKNLIRFKLEFDKLWIHGLVHLLGYDHKKNKDYVSMNNVEKKFLFLIK